jgi:hypothetical protein
VWLISVVFRGCCWFSIHAGLCTKEVVFLHHQPHADCPAIAAPGAKETKRGPTAFPSTSVHYFGCLSPRHHFHFVLEGTMMTNVLSRCDSRQRRAQQSGRSNAKRRYLSARRAIKNSIKCVLGLTVIDFAPKPSWHSIQPKRSPEYFAYLPWLDLENPFGRFVPICTFTERSSINYLRKLRLGPQFCEVCDAMVRVLTYRSRYGCCRNLRLRPQFSEGSVPDFVRTLVLWF